ncbi:MULTISPECIES: YjjG family noncanonical pyrimidine nucleotidase [unclassified Duganella]|jgi:2-haloacid dehalogenase|uniref:YjjG family noncanonical pyrimidine nucleotidase n=1 Tax=unclassified Duganella TaxID=2636909 RepID=UPI00087E9CD0|nr:MULTISPECIES: YjjG family noncanonical pyrimidine nucleotidase [unclassified Duganella]SDF63175.1 2-haloacid dehalogenase [Duganella sp. OV458]SDI65284.1 2-haloacid dehalogenase [Duganella sp. OV510]
MKHKLFLFDLDDTLLDFKASEQLSFARTLQALGLTGDMAALFLQYQAINIALWRAFETGSVSKDFLKVERFRKTFMENGLELDPEAASQLYLESLSDTVVLIDGAVQLCETLAGIGEVGIITNGVEAIQNQRILKSGLRDSISFVATSEASGYAKPDVRFFEYAAQMARPFVKEEAIIIGDRLDADILGANRYGIESCWFNPERLVNASEAVPTYQVSSLHDIMRAVA